MEVPELYLPMFKSPYRVASGMVGNAFGSQQQMQNGGFNADQWIENAMKKFFFKKMLKEMMESEFDMDDDDDDDEMPGGPMRFFKASRRRNRYVSIIPIIFEKIMPKKMVNKREKLKLMSSDQHGEKFKIDGFFDIFFSFLRCKKMHCKYCFFRSKLYNTNILLQ